MLIVSELGGLPVARERPGVGDPEGDPPFELALGAHSLALDPQPSIHRTTAHPKGCACWLPSNPAVSAESTRSSRPPRPLTVTDMLPLIRKARPPNVRCSATPSSIRTSSRILFARSSS